MKIKLEDEGFEEVQAEKQGEKPETGGSNRPDLRVVQADRDKDGNVVYTNVGGMWKNVSKNGNEFYTLKIGQLKLLVFPNNNK
ncbi:hypothetical protein JXA56_03500 [Candidatus Micrarchaeota archaeon]|nr:hypothetical protein [Candidatus Micrarchaeota archaeon]